MRQQKALVLIALLCCMTSSAVSSYTSEHCAIFATKDATGDVNLISGRYPNWGKPLERFQNFKSAIVGDDNEGCSTHHSSVSYKNKYVLVEPTSCKGGNVTMQDYYTKANNLKKLGAAGMLVNCPDEEELCRNFGQDKDFEQTGGAYAGFEVVSSQMSTEMLDEIRSGKTTVSVYNPVQELLSKTTFILAFIVICVIIVASCWCMPLLESTESEDFTLGTLFIYAYAIYLGYKHGYKASDILARPNPHAQPLGDVDSTPDTTSFEESQQMSTQGASMSRNEENEEKSNSSLGLYFCMFLTMSTILMVVFFFRKYFIGLIVFVFALGGSLSFATVLQALVYQCAPHLFEKRVTIMCLRQEQFRVTSWIMSFFCMCIGVTWFFYRELNFSVLMHNIFSASICISVLQKLSVPNLRTMLIVYVVGVFYDVFWTFITPAIFGSSVMVQVATGETNTDTCLDIGIVLPLERTNKILKELPFLLEMPKPCDDWSCASSAVVGLGDVLIPGLMLVFCARIDKVGFGKRAEITLSTTKRFVTSNIYYFVAVIAYILGLLWTYVSYVLMEGNGQPALLFILPSLYVSVSLTAMYLGDFEALWNGCNVPYRMNSTGQTSHELDPLEEGLLEEAQPLM